MSDERGAVVTMFCANCGEGITLRPIAIPEKVAKLLPSLLSMLGSPMSKIEQPAGGDARLFGMTGYELTEMLWPMCYTCSLNEPARKHELSTRPILAALSGDDDGK